EDLRIVGRSLGAAVPGEVVVGAVAVVLLVGLVVLPVMADEVGQGEAVVAGEEVDAPGGGAEVVRVEVARARPGGRRRARDPRLAAPDASDHVAVTAVPLRPARSRKRPQMIQPGGVPGLGDEGALGQRRPQLDVPGQGWIGEGRAVLAAYEHAGEV